MSDLLPPNATPQERALDDATARVSAVPVPIRDVWNPDTCPASLLPWLAWAFSVDAWPPGMTEQQQRDAVKASVEIHRHKGTIGAVRDALGALGVGSTVVEWWQDSPAGSPYTFRIEVNAAQTPVTLETMGQIVELVERTKNVRSHLTGIAPSATTRAELYVGSASGVGSSITNAGVTGAGLKLDGTWRLDASQRLDGFKHSETRKLDGSWSLNGSTVLNGIQV